MSEMSIEQQKERIRRRMRTEVDKDRYICMQASGNNNSARLAEYQRIVIYARISTIGQCPEHLYKPDDVQPIGDFVSNVSNQIAANCSQAGKNNKLDEMQEDVTNA